MGETCSPLFTKLFRDLFMAGLLAVLMMAVVGMVAAAFAINFFWQLGYRQAFTLATLFIGVFLLFWASGLWEGASRHSWGVLAPLFALFLCSLWLIIHFLPSIMTFIRRKLRK